MGHNFTETGIGVWAFFPIGAKPSCPKNCLSDLTKYHAISETVFTVNDSDSFKIALLSLIQPLINLKAQIFGTSSH